MNKQELRVYVRMQKAQYKAEQLNAMSQTVVRRLLAHPRLRASQTVLAYYSLDDEVNTHALIDQLVAQGKRVLLPAVTSETEMELRCYEGAEDLQGGFFNIMEPVGALFSEYDKIETAIIPGVGFDSRNNRLGRGRGYYDRLLPRIPDTYKIGVCFPFQLLPGIPTEEHDCRMDEVMVADML